VVRRFAGPPFLLLRVHFFVLWWSGVFAGVLQKNSVLVWCFCGENVVDCVVNVVHSRSLFERLKK
jgi:hypothetical protein